MKPVDFIGVAGTDITIESLKDTVPRPRLGTFGHAFIITNNGFVVMHPDFIPQSGRVPSPPSPPNILLEDLEHATNEVHIVLFIGNSVACNL